MGALKDAVIAATLEQVRVVYLDGATARWWNQRRDKDDTAVFTGWYWVRGAAEGGPFKTCSAALRDAYYAHVAHRKAPAVGHVAIKGVPKPKAARPRRTSPKLNGAGARP